MDWHFADGHNSCVEELQLCKTESHTSERSCAEASSEYFNFWEIRGLGEITGGPE